MRSSLQRLVSTYNPEYFLVISDMTANDTVYGQLYLLSIETYRDKRVYRRRELFVLAHERMLLREHIPCVKNSVDEITWLVKLLTCSTLVFKNVGVPKLRYRSKGVMNRIE